MATPRRRVRVRGGNLSGEDADLGIALADFSAFVRELASGTTWMPTGLRGQLAELTLRDEYRLARGGSLRSRPRARTN